MRDGTLIRKILVASDGSEISLKAARYAAEIAACTNAEVVILTAAEATAVTQFVTSAIPHGGSAQEEMRHTATHVIEDTRKPFLEADVRQVHTKIIEGPASEVILDEAKAGSYDLIAMGSRGAGAGLTQRLILGMGSVAQRVLSSAPCPVLIVRE